MMVTNAIVQGPCMALGAAAVPLTVKRGQTHDLACLLLSIHLRGLKQNLPLDAPNDIRKHRNSPEAHQLMDGEVRPGQPTE